MPLACSMNGLAASFYELPAAPHSLSEIRPGCSGDCREGVGGNVEMLLTYLYEAMPWKTLAEIYEQKSAFLTLSMIIADYIRECEEEVFQTEPPEWAKDFIQYLHQTKQTVVTFNYDTILERLSRAYTAGILDGQEARIELDDLYDSPIGKLATRSGGWFFGSSHIETCRLLKPHGSVNWYFPGNEDIDQQNVYYSDVFILDNPSHPDVQTYIKSTERNKQDLIPLIIPPVAEKTSFYGISLVRALWQASRKAIEEADEIYCVGYSLVKTDLPVRILFSTVMDSPTKKVYIVNLKKGSCALIKNYREVLRSCELITDYILDDNPIREMVESLVK